MKQSETNKKKTENKKKERTAGVFAHILSGGGVVVGEKLRSEVTAAVIAKYALYAAMSLFLILLRTTFFSRFRIFGVSPDILIVAVAAIALFEGARAGAIFGVAIGFIADALGGVGVILLPLAYMLVGYVCGAIATDHYRRSWLLFLIFDVSVLPVRMFLSLSYILLTWHAFDLSVVWSSVLVPELCSTLAASPLPAILLLPIYLIFRKKRKELD